MEEASAAREGVQGEITAVEDTISKLNSKLDSLAVELQRPTLDEDAKDRLLAERRVLWRERDQLWKQHDQLWAQGDQLRAKIKRLWTTKQERLWTEKEEEQRALSSLAYLQRVLDMEAPSMTNMKREQLDKAGGPLINSWRPTQEAAGGLLPALAHLTFGEVVELLASNAAVDEDAINVAAQLCCICADIYDNEAQLAKYVRGLLLPYLAAGPAVAQITSGFACNDVSPDWALGDRANDPQNLFLIGEIKPGIGGYSGDSHFRGANYHLHFWRRRTASNIFKDTRCPAFLLEVVGPHVRLSAVAWLDRVTVFPLTPLLNLLPAHPVTKSLLMPVARLLAALRVGLHKLAQAHAAMPAAHTADEPADQVAQAGPAGQAGAQDTRATEADDVEPGAEDDVKAEDVQRYAGADMFKLPWPIAMDARYDAETARPLAAPNYTYSVDLAGTNESVVVKLCESYGLEAHQEWAELGLAPKILRSTTLPGGWLLVEMEWLPAPKWRRLSRLSEKELRQAHRAVQQALERAHIASNMVHGDLRPPNCLVRRGRGRNSWEVRFVDFEWAGPEGEATYPACLNPDIPWPEGVRYGKPLQREHDIQLLAATLAAAGITTAAPSTTTRATGGRQRGTRGPGTAQSLHTAANYGSAVPPGTAAISAGHRIVRVSWRQRGGISWTTRTAAPGRPLVW